MPESRPPAEMTFKAVGLGLLLSLIFGAANAYLGMKAGQTIAATIPAAVIAIALFRLPAFRGTVLEQNIVRTAASVGEALVAAAIFTIPAFVLVEIDGVRLWTDLRHHYWEATMILLVGGLIGVLFIIVLRRPLCVDSDLPFPESVASAEIVKAGEQGSDAPKYVFGAMAFGGLLQILKSDKGLQIFREYSEGFFAFPRSVVHHFNFRKEPIGDVVHGGGIYWTTPNLSPALMGIGYIIGPQLSAINFAGGVLAWWVLIPLLLFFDPDLARRLGASANPQWDVAAYTVWYNIVRPIAVGTMLVGAANTLLSMRGSIAESIRGALAVSRAAGREGGDTRAPIDRDIPFRWLVLGTVALTAAITAIYYHFTQSWTAALVAAAVMSVTGFLLSAVGGYLTGLVGSSNQPLSGLTLVALMLAAAGDAGHRRARHARRGGRAGRGVGGGVRVLGLRHSDPGPEGRIPAGRHAVENAGGRNAGGNSAVGVSAAADHRAAPGESGDRRHRRARLPAPQAGLMAQLAKGIVGGQMAWGLIGIGAAFGLALTLCGSRAPMLVAVGMYLPFDTVSAIFAGGAIKWVADRVMAGYSAPERVAGEERGTLLASGLIAGEAIVGILTAVTFLAGISSITHVFTGRDELSFYPAWGGWLSLAGFAAVAWVLIRIPARKRA